MDGPPTDVDDPSSPDVPARRLSKLPPAPAWDWLPPGVSTEPPQRLALAIWRRVTDARLWANCPADSRAALFAGAAFQVGIPGKQNRAVRDALDALGFLVRYPEVMRPADAGVACRTIYAWAENEGHLHTALAFAETWAFCCPDSPEAAATAGQMAMRAGYEGRASAWLSRAGAVARVAGSEEWIIRSRLRTGILLLQLGRIDAARAVLRKVARRAMKAGQTEWAGKAHHDLLLSHASDAFGYGKAHGHLEHALRLYPVRNPRIPYLIHDFAVILIRHGAYRQALRALEAVYPCIPPANRIIIHATTARACAGIRDHDGFQRGAGLVQRAAARSEESASFALLHVAEGARLLGEWDVAERYAASGLQIALKRHELDAVRVAYAILDAVTTRAQLHIVGAPDAQVGAAVDRCLERLAKLSVPSARHRIAAFPASQVISTAWVP